MLPRLPVAGRAVKPNIDTALPPTRCKLRLQGGFLWLDFLRSQRRSESYPIIPTLRWPGFSVSIPEMSIEIQVISPRRSSGCVNNRLCRGRALDDARLVRQVVLNASRSGVFVTTFSAHDHASAAGATAAARALSVI